MASPNIHIETLEQSKLNGTITGLGTNTTQYISLQSFNRKVDNFKVIKKKLLKLLTLKIGIKLW